jgi:hypothetical protein
MKFIALLLTLCTLSFVPVNATMAGTPATITPQSKTITLVGTIKKVEVEGGCYQFVATDGKNYELMGKFPTKEGTRFKVTGTLATDVATICQVGQPFKVKSVQILRSR